MKRKLFLVVLVLIIAMLLVGCSGEGIVTPIMEDVLFENKTANTLSVQITSTYIETDIDSFTIEPGSIKIIKS